MFVYGSIAKGGIHIMKEIKWLITTIKGYKKFIYTGWGLSILCTILAMAFPYLFATLVREVIEKGNKDRLFPILASMLLVVLIRVLVRYGMQRILEFASQNIFKKIRDQIYKKLQELDFSYFDRHGTGELMVKIVGDTDVIRNFIAAAMSLIIENVLYFVFAFIVISTINWQLMLILLTISPVIGIVTYKFSKRIKPIFLQIREQYSKLNSVVEENISGNRVVKAYTREAYEIQKFDKENDEYMRINVEATKTNARFAPILDGLSSTMIFIFLISGGTFLYLSKIEMWQFVAINSYLWAIIGPMRMSSNLINELQRFYIATNRIMEILRAEPLIENPKNAIYHVVEGVVEFKSVSFGYPGEKITLKNISFKANKGEVIAIVGPTGSGKTTLASLISRFYDIGEGEVLVDDINVKNYNIQNLRSKIGIAMQDVFLFSETIEGNIAFGVPDISFDEVVAAAKIAGADGFIRKMPEGYDTIVGERGVGLSGGQRQRLSLARALCKNPSILILDDTTSAVDMETEREIQKALNGVLKDKTTFIIAHRISSVKHADQILVLEDGVITERGTHQELLAKKGYYYSIFETQLGTFADRIEGQVVNNG